MPSDGVLIEDFKSTNFFDPYRGGKYNNPLFGKPVTLVYFKVKVCSGVIYEFLYHRLGLNKPM